jgi:hypothetical protein
MATIKNSRNIIPPKIAIKNILFDLSKVSEIETKPKAKLKYAINPAIREDFINSKESKLNQ